jgi:hypothetical protein
MPKLMKHVFLQDKCTLQSQSVDFMDDDLEVKLKTDYAR